eukprot:TRINITY_DN5387_c0_g1_i2.p1 TRINITY_DN5387_c0_g1~~TRINITY_DN5387_c0_g1_i2.p1  ORF type:complete len:178 (-),score=17.30 TRINITY_DN5387_c0_g1_i2:96-629(-)
MCLIIFNILIIIAKLGDLAIPLEHRNKLCVLATKDSTWLDVCDWGWANAWNIMKEIDIILQKNMSGEKFEVWLVAGADHARRHGLYMHDINVVCIGRPGETEELCKEMKSRVSPSHKVLGKFVLVDTAEEDVSSTEIRSIIISEKPDWDSLEKMLPCAEVVEYLKKYGKTIFTDKKS